MINFFHNRAIRKRIKRREDEAARVRARYLNAMERGDKRDMGTYHAVMQGHVHRALELEGMLK